MIKKKKRVFKTFFPWQYEEEQNWLEKMAKEGWLLEKAGLWYQFQAGQPKDVIYRLDFVEISRKKIAAYRQIFIDSGWEFVTSNWSGFQYFRIPADQFNTDIYSDVPSRIEQLRRVRNLALLMAAVWIVILTPFNNGDGRQFVLGNLLIFGLPGVLYAWWAFHIHRRMKKLEKEQAD